MAAYIFSGCTNDPVTRGLIAFRENGDKLGYFSAFTRLMEFAGCEGVTGHTIREYCVHMLLDVPKVGELLAIPSLSPYLERDIAGLYELYFRDDWDALCQKNGILPVPIGSCETARDNYRAAMTRLIAASSPSDLLSGMRGFFYGNADRLEAMYAAQRWDGHKLHPILHPDPITFDMLGGLAYQKRMLAQNTRVFLDGKPANDILLVGGSGTGKSSCVKATLNQFAADGLRLAELSKKDIDTLPQLLRTLRGKRRHYIVYIDDLTFESADSGYMGLKVALDGQMEERPANVLICATSNQRHLVRDAREEHTADLSDSANENLSLSKRFGIHLYFSNLTPSEYNAVLELLLTRYGISFNQEIARSASAWSAANGGRSGRSAKQFVSQYMAR